MKPRIRVRDLRSLLSAGERTASGCLLWTGCVNNSNFYGSCYFSGRYWAVHRLSYQLAYGPIPKGLLVLHGCEVFYPVGDFSSRRCIEPSHLRLGTQAENVVDMQNSGRIANGQRHSSIVRRECRPRGADHHRAKVSEKDIREMYQRICSGERQQSIADDYGVTQAYVSLVKYGKARVSL